MPITILVKGKQKFSLACLVPLSVSHGMSLPGVSFVNKG